MFFIYKGVSFIPLNQELLLYKNGVLIASFPINKELMNSHDLVEKIDEVLEM